MKQYRQKRYSIWKMGNCTPMLKKPIDSWPFISCTSLSKSCCPLSPGPKKEKEVNELPITSDVCPNLIKYKTCFSVLTLHSFCHR
ncbi:unnamed protein product, partial [Vitis vinifera]